MIYKETVGATSTLVLKENPNRQKVTFTNPSDEAIYLSDVGAAITGAGVYVASGGSASDEKDLEGYIHKGPWFAICASGGKDIAILEQSR